MDSQEYPALQPAIKNAEPLSENVVMFNNEFFSGDTISILFDSATKEQLKVFNGSEELPGASVIMAGSVLLGEKIRIGKGVLIESGAFIQSPAIIGDYSEIRQGSYMRGYCLIGKKCVVGHVTEVKHSLFLNDAKAGHFAYVGDSILGNDVNLGAGTKLANLRFTSGAVEVRIKGGSLSTGLRKLGAILGDNVQTGCNSVTNPGTLLGKKSMVLPNTTVPSGLHGDRSIIR